MTTRKILVLFFCIFMIGLLAACGHSAPAETAAETSDEEAIDTSQIAASQDMTTVEDVVSSDMTPIYAASLNDGFYPISVDSSSSMFSITDCVLQVAGDQMTATMKMGGTGYLYVYPGTPEQAAAAASADLIPFTENSDGSHSFTVPVEALDAGVKCAAFSKSKEQWYDRTLVFRASSLPLDAFSDGVITTVDSLGLADGSYYIDVTLAGGSGKAYVESPALLVIEGGSCTATIIWSSPNYDYMIVDGEKYLPLNTDGNSTYEIPVNGFDFKLPVSADTTAMSEPHEIDYTLYFDSTTVQAAAQ